MSVETPVHEHEPPLPGTPEYDAAPMLLHQFDDLPQQEFTSNLGMWAFLATEVMFFGGLILAFFLYRHLYHAEFVAAASYLNITLGAINTVVLLLSSFTMALAVRASKLRRRNEAVLLLLATLTLGTTFLVIKGFEWTADYREKLIPSINFEWNPEERAEANARGAEHHDPVPEANPDQLPGLVGPETEPNYSGEESYSTAGSRAAMFYVLYFFMTGLHGIHVIVGIVLVGVMAWLTWRGWLSGCGATQIEVTGLYWHFIDIVWVYLYPLLYLVDRH
jgi:cytochrome c oxidase subunit 3